jgi:hypothetical protein
VAKPDLRNNKKFRKLRRLLPEPVPHLIGYLDCLWHQGYQTGDPFIGDATDVEAAAEYPGEPGRFVKAAHESGFLDQDGSGNYLIHELYEHAPRYVRLRMARKGFAPPGAHTGAHGARTTSAHCDGNGAHDAPPPRAESREPEPKAESQEPEKAEVSPPPGSAGAGPEPPAPSGSPEMWGNGAVRYDPAKATWHGITERQWDIWAKAFPAVDLEADLAKATAWCAANPKEARRSNYTRFLTNWFQRTQDRGGNRARSPPPGRSGPRTRDDDLVDEIRDARGDLG